MPPVLCPVCEQHHRLTYGGESSAYWKRNGRSVNWEPDYVDVLPGVRRCIATVFTFFDRDLDDVLRTGGPRIRDLYRWPESYIPAPGE